jgi:23S rRNA (guanosine2251-2'-O)-methyltransferase
MRRTLRPATSIGNHNRGWIWGRHVVLETLRAGRWRPLELLVSPRCADEPRREALRLAEQLGLNWSEGTDAALARQCRADDHQGLAAAMPPFPYADFHELLSPSRRPETAPLTSWLVLDRLHDSFNFGAVLRTAHALGIGAVVVGDVEQSDVNSQAVRSSAGAVNYIPIARVASLQNAVGLLRDAGCAIVAATEKASRPVYELNLAGPVAVVIGNEGRGIQPDLLARCTAEVCIPMSGRVGSLNAAVAAGIFCYEIARQRSRLTVPLPEVAPS